MNIYEQNLEANPANYAALTPLHFIERTAQVFPHKTAIIHGTKTATWKEERDRSVRLASALKQRGIGKGDTVAVMAANIPPLFEAHFGIPMAGAVLNALNTRLDAAAIAFILNHSEAKILISGREFAPIIEKALPLLERQLFLIDIDDGIDEGKLLGQIEYEAFLQEGDPNFAWQEPANEWDAISLNYTSGTTGNPKGVVYHHRGAYLNALGNSITWDMAHHPVYLWTLPMFHCNGWCFPWTITALAGTHVCLRRVDAGNIFKAIFENGVTHLCGAPIVLNMLINHPDKKPLPRQVKLMTAAAPPPATVLEAIEKVGFKITHVYGLTEVYGPATVCAWDRDWDQLSAVEQARLKSRQGVRYLVEEGLMVADPKTLEPVPPDATTMGEVFFRGNVVMKGYLKNPKATAEAFAGGWFHSGDLGVLHPDGYIELKDRSKDIIISGGENISTIEVEGVIYQHPAVLEVSVVARPDEKWGETPCAFVTLKTGHSATEAEIIQFCRERLAHFKCPRTIVFSELPKTSTGKIQKFVLREKAAKL